MRVALMLLAACGTVENPPLQAQSQTQSLEGVWTGRINDAGVRAEFDTGRLTLDMSHLHYEGFYAFDGAVIQYEIDEQTLTGPTKVLLDASLGDQLRLDVGPLVPNTPKVVVLLQAELP